MEKVYAFFVFLENNKNPSHPFQYSGDDSPKLIYYVQDKIQNCTSYFASYRYAHCLTNLRMSNVWNIRYKRVNM